MAEDDALLVQPRTLARTCMIDRGVVTIADGRVSVSAPASSADGTKSKPTTISAERFWEAMAQRDPTLPSKTRAFLARLETLGVYPDFRRSLILRWDTPEGRPLNLGYIRLDGRVETDAANWFVSHDLSHRYVEEFAERIGGEVDREAKGNWSVLLSGKTPRLEAIAGQIDAWYEAIRNFIGHVQASCAEGP